MKQPMFFDKAEWIWSDDIQTVNQYVEFQTVFLAEDFQDARLYISADSEYVARINGVVLDIHQYGDYPAYKVYEDIDITSLVKNGDNRLEITAYCQNEDSFSYRKNIPGLLFSVMVDGSPLCVSNEGVQCRPSPEYVSGEVSRLTPQLAFSFEYKPTKAAAWRPAAVIPREVTLYPCPIRRLQVLPPVSTTLQACGAYKEFTKDAPWGDRMQNAWLSARSMESPLSLPCEEGVSLSSWQGDGVYALIDLGRETVGYVTLDVECPTAFDVLVGFGEHLDDLRVRTSVGVRQFAALLHFDAGRHTFTYRFKRWGCRYLQLHIASPKATLYYAGMLPVEYPVTYRPELPLEDHLHQRIAQVARRSLELCMHDHYEDCPWREQGLYGMDSMLQMMCGYVVFDNPEFAASALRLLGLGAREDGLLELCAPARAPITIPSFALAWIMALRNYREVTGDTTLITEMRPVWEAVLETFAKQVDEKGLVHRFPHAEHWNFYEWTEGMSGSIGSAESAAYVDAPAQALYILALKAAEELADALQDPSAAVGFAEQRKRLIAAAEYFWNSQEQAYVTTAGEDAEPMYHELTQALMICAGVPDAARTKVMCDKLTDPKAAGLVPISLSYTMFKYMALLTKREDYEAYIWQNILDIWGPMVFSGATSFWETEQGSWDFAAAGSLCHGWSAVPLWVYNQLLK